GLRDSIGLAVGGRGTGYGVRGRGHEARSGDRIIAGIRRSIASRRRRALEPAAAARAGIEAALPHAEMLEPLDHGSRLRRMLANLPGALRRRARRVRQRQLAQRLPVRERSLRSFLPETLPRVRRPPARLDGLSGLGSERPWPRRRPTLIFPDPMRPWLKILVGTLLVAAAAVAA